MTDSIESLTTEKIPDPFVVVQKHQTIDYNEIVHNIKRDLSYKESQAFDDGLSYYKSTTSDERILLKGIFSLIKEMYSKRIRTSEMPLDQKDAMIQLINDTFKSCETIICGVVGTNIALNKNPLMLPREMALGLLGFCINLERSKN